MESGSVLGCGSVVTSPQEGVVLVHSADSSAQQSQSGLDCIVSSGRKTVCIRPHGDMPERYSRW